MGRSSVEGQTFAATGLSGIAHGMFAGHRYLGCVVHILQADVVLVMEQDRLYSQLAQELKVGL